MPKKVACPGCAASYNIPDNMPKRNVTCRNCKATFEVGGEAPAPSPAAITPAKPKPSPVTLEAHANDEAEGQLEAVGDSKFTKAMAGGKKALEKSKQALTGEKKHVWFSVLGGGALALMLMSCVLCGGSWWLFRSVTGSGSYAKQDDAEDPGLPPVDTSDIEPAAIPPNATGQLIPEVRDRLKQSTVFIRVTDSDGDQGSGSGFFGAGLAGPDIVVTNAHVVGMLEPDSKKPNKIEIILNSGDRATEMKMPGEVLGVDRVSDLALLRALPTAEQRAKLPKPLDVKTSKRLFETQRLFVVGFPLGEQLGKEITFSDSSVGSLRKDENGHLNRVQVNGGMHSGNSGGPVIDLAGNIVGVAVSGLRGTTINFAIPGDHVHSIMNGKIENAVIEQPYLKDGKTVAHCTLYKIDPLRRIRQSAVMVWTAPPGSPRPPAFADPGAQDGDSPHVKAVLRTKDEHTVQGDVPLPALPAGQVYWAQPYWVNGRGEPRWAAGAAYELSAPVERKPAQLAMKHANGQRLVNLNQKSTLKIGAGSVDKTRVVNTDTSLMEVTRNVDNQGTADNRWEYKTFKITAKEGDEAPPPEVQRDLQNLMQNLPLVTATQRVSKQNVASPTVADLARVPLQNRQDVVKLHDEIRQGLEALSVTMPPNPAVAPLQTWKTTRTVPMRSLGGPGGAAQMETTYTFLGTRTNAGRQEAVIGIKGVLHGPANNGDFTLGGRSDGSAVFDVAAGQFSSANLTNVVDVNINIGRGSIKVSGTVESKMQRQVK